MQLKQNSFSTVLKLFCVSFASTVRPFYCLPLVFLYRKIILEVLTKMDYESARTNTEFKHNDMKYTPPPNTIKIKHI